MLQIRVSVPEFSSGVRFTDPIILEMANDISLTKTINSSDETISFNLPAIDPKMEYVNYLRWWECWDTVTNRRINYGPIREISRNSAESTGVTGPGRSALLEDFYKTVQTFYYPIERFLDDLRYENLSAQPRTSTRINKNTDSDYYGLSLRTKDRAVDEQTGFIAIGRDEPIAGSIKTDSYWSGVGKADYLIIDLGEPYKISKSRVLLPWWGGETVNTNRAYDWSFQYGDDGTSFTTVWQSDIPNRAQTHPATLGATLNFEGNEDTPFEGLPILARYWKLDITDTHAWYGNVFTGTTSDEWDWECGGSDVFIGETRESPKAEPLIDGDYTVVASGISFTPPEVDLIPKDELSPSSDCHASAVELAFYRKIIGRDTLSNLSYVQIQNDNKQITYSHVPAASEMISAGGKVKFEPGTFFRKIDFTGGGTIKDEWNTTLYEGGAGHLDAPAFTRLLRFSDPASQIHQVDTWQGRMDAFSYGASYQYTTIANDYAILHFRGISVKWYGTVPAGSTPAQVSIELRSLDDETGIWSSWDVLEAALDIPINVSAHKMWEITVESALLEDETTYELRFTNLNGGFVSIDAFAGYWSGSMVELNEDDARFRVRVPNEVIQEYDKKFTGGRIYKYKDGGTMTKQSLQFVGDRVIVYARKGPHFGILKLALFSGGGIFPIPGGDGDGSLVIDLESVHDITQAVVFDSADYFTDSGLPWAAYSLGIYKPDDDDPIWLDGVAVHERTGISLKFLDTNYLDILKNTAEVLQMEWDITEEGMKVVPRLGEDTDEIYAEGRGTTIKIENVEDSANVATMLIVTGADIDGLPLNSIVEDKNTKKIIGRTIQRPYDIRNVADMYTLIGAARAELIRRRGPQKRVTITRVGALNNSYGDSFMVKTPELEGRFRAITVTRSQSADGGTEHTMECLEWPPVI